MPAQSPAAYATLSVPLPAKPYILDIKPSNSNPHLYLRHPSSEITIADNQSLQAIDTFRDGHSGHVSDICVDGESIWSSGKEGSVVKWDERSRRPAQQIKAFVRKPLPVLAVASAERDHLVVAGTELVSSEAHILYWDTRNAKQHIYAHASTHSDDITHLSFLPSTSSFLSSSSSHPLPTSLLLSASTDGLVALSNPKETDEEEAVLSAENWGQSIAKTGVYAHKGKMRVWARSDMDGIALWEVGRGEEEDLELQNMLEYPTETFREKTWMRPRDGIAVPRTAEEEMRDKEGKITSDYLVDVVPTLGVSKSNTPMVALGSNEGDIVLVHQSTKDFQPSGYFLSGPGPSRGHKDVVRALYHDISNEAIYTGSEDGVLSGWSLASLPSRLLVGDPEIDDDGGDGREAINSEDESEESEIVTEESEMDVDESEDERPPGPRNGPILGGGRDEGRKQKRREKRHNPY